MYVQWCIILHFQVSIKVTLGKLKLFLIVECTGALVSKPIIQTSAYITSLKNYTWHLYLVSVSSPRGVALTNGKILHASSLTWLITFLFYLIIRGTKKSRRLVNKYIEKSNKEVRNFYWENDLFKLLHCLRAEKYKKFKFGFRKEIRLLSSKYPNFSLGFFGLVVLNVDL